MSGCLFHVCESSYANPNHAKKNPEPSQIEIGRPRGAVTPGHASLGYSPALWHSGSSNALVADCLSERTDDGGGEYRVHRNGVINVNGLMISNSRVGRRREVRDW